MNGIATSLCQVTISDYSYMPFPLLFHEVELVPQQDPWCTSTYHAFPLTLVSSSSDVLISNARLDRVVNGTSMWGTLSS